MSRVCHLYVTCVSRVCHLYVTCVSLSPPVQVRDEAPRYYEIIQTPMDLGTIKARFKKKEYGSAQEVMDDVNTVWENCR